MPVEWRNWEHFSKKPINPRANKTIDLEGKATTTIEDTAKATVQSKTNYGEAATLELSGNYFREKGETNVTSLTESKATTRTLKVGCKGDDVKRLQENLNTLGYNTGKPDGIFGNGTKNAVIAFQKAKGLSPDGIVGSGTQNAITRALNEKNAATNSNILKVGSKGVKVTQLQSNLNSLGYNAGTPDGAFGNGTKNAVIAFQKTYGLTPDGIVGKSTQDAITITVNRKSKGVLSKGQVSNDVKSLQSDLKTLGYLSSNPDGAFGTVTESAVKAFQQRHNLTIDGLVGSSTRAQIAAAVKAKTQPKPESNILKIGSKGEKVRILQSNLNALGYDTGKPDGDFGGGTQTAVIKFQKTYGLTPDGQVGTNTQDAISKALYYKNNGVLSKGQVSEDVRVLQNNLKSLGYLSGTADGAFGVNTEKAVIAFQKATGIVSNGVVDLKLKESITTAARTSEQVRPKEEPRINVNVNDKTKAQMISNIQNDSSLNLSSEKKTAMIKAAEVLFNDGFEVEFVAGMLGNIMEEGTLGKFESSYYKSHPEQKPDYLKDADDNFSYGSTLSGKNIRDVGLKKTMEIEDAMYKQGYDVKGNAKFGLGMIQWTGNRTHTLLQKYKEVCKSDIPTLEECAIAEATMISEELHGSEKEVYNTWLKSDKTAASAGIILCKEYERPKVDSSATRGDNARNIYNIMMKGIV